MNIRRVETTDICAVRRITNTNDNTRIMTVTLTLFHVMFGQITKDININKNKADRGR